MKLTILPTTDAPPFILEHFEAMAERSETFTAFVALALLRWQRLNIYFTFEAVRFIPGEPEAPEAIIEIEIESHFGMNPLSKLTKEERQFLALYLQELKANHPRRTDERE